MTVWQKHLLKIASVALLKMFSKPLKNPFGRFIPKFFFNFTPASLLKSELLHKFFNCFSTVAEQLFLEHLPVIDFASAVLITHAVVTPFNLSVESYNLVCLL